MHMDTKIYRSGDLYLVVRGLAARLVPGDGRPARGAAPRGSILAHCNVQEPWVAVPEGESVPDEVARVAASDDGWELPDWAREDRQ